MQQLEPYCMEMRCINDLDTYIISPQYYEKLLSDTDLMKLLWWNKDQHGQHHLPPDWQEERIKSMMEVSRRVDSLYFAVVRHKGRPERFVWKSVHCYHQEDTFYHVMYRESWRCIDCGYWLEAPLIMPMVESDALFYCGTENRWPDTPPIFQKVQCPNCGMMLNNHLMLL